MPYSYCEVTGCVLKLSDDEEQVTMLKQKTDFFLRLFSVQTQIHTTLYNSGLRDMIIFFIPFKESFEL